MNDLSIAILILACCCGIAFAVGVGIARHRSSFVRLTSQIVAIVLLPIYFATVWEHPFLASILPVSGLIILGNWLPLWASFFLGIYTQTFSIAIGRRLTIGTVTCGFIAYSTVAPVIGTAPECGQQDRTLQYQTTPFTCSAACAASILSLHGIDASEGELAEMCLTRSGTHWMGVYRGLMLKTAETGWTVEVSPFCKETMSEIVAPCILALNVDTSVFESDLDHGFHSDVGHSVVYLGTSPHDASVVFDPSPDFGMEDWLPSMRSTLSSGIVLRLVPDSDSIVSTAMVDERVEGLLRHRRLTAGITRTK